LRSPVAGNSFRERQKQEADSTGQRNTLGCISLEVLYGHDQKGSDRGRSS
jgi:hypothetical protein